MRKRVRYGLIILLSLVMINCSNPICLADGDTVEVYSDGTNITVAVNGSKLTFDQQPYISNGRTMVPFRGISEALGAKVDWDSTNNKVTIKTAKTIELTVGSKTALVDGKSYTLDIPAEISGGRVMVPLRFVGESLGLEVKYKQPAKPTSDEDVVDAKVQEIIAKIIKPDMQNLDKAYAICQYLNHNATYGFGPHCYSAYGILIDGVGVCNGFALAAQKLFSAEGIENYFVTGTLQSDLHAWNIIKIDNNYFHVDATRGLFIMNDLTAKQLNYKWIGDSFPKCESSFNLPKVICSYWADSGYIYYPPEYLDMNNVVMPKVLGSPKDIYKSKPDGSDNTKVFTTKHAASQFVQYGEWVYYFDYSTQQGVYKVRFDGSDDTKVSDQVDIGRIYLSNGYLFIEHKEPVVNIIVSRNAKPSTVRKRNKVDIIIHRVNLETGQEDKITVEQGMEWIFYLEGIGDYIYYVKPENDRLKHYRMTLDGKEKDLLLDVPDPVARNIN